MNLKVTNLKFKLNLPAEIILGMNSSSEIQCYSAMLLFIGWAHLQNDPRPGANELLTSTFWAKLYPPNLTWYLLLSCFSDVPSDSGPVMCPSCEHDNADEPVHLVPDEVSIKVGLWSNMKCFFKSCCGVKTVVNKIVLSHNGISCTGKTTSVQAQEACLPCITPPRG